MKKLLTVVLTLLLVGCASVPPAENVSYSVQTDENVQNKQQTADPGQNSTESGTDLPDTQDSAENDDLGEPNLVDAPSAADFALSSEIIEDDICKLREDSYPRREWNDTASSFPAMSNISMPRTGTINVKVVYVEWDDLKGTKNDYDYNLWSAKMFGEFYRVMSEGKLNFNVTSEPEWITVGSSWEVDAIPSGMEGGNAESTRYVQPVIDRWISALDPVVDFSGVDILIYGLPSAELVVDGLHTFDGGPIYAATQEGRIYDMFSLGQRIYDHRESLPGWAQFSHEFGHSLGMPDLRDFSTADRSTKYIVNPMFGHDIMDNQDAGSRSISGWMKWVQGWLDDSQVICVDADTVEAEYYELTNANIVGADSELLTVKVSDTMLIAVESTRWDSRFDLRTNNPADGVIVYTVDATLGHHEGPLKLLSPRDITEYLSDDHIWPDWRVLDVVLLEGDSVTYEGITITVASSGENSDIVRVSR